MVFSFNILTFAASKKENNDYDEDNNNPAAHGSIRHR